MTDQPFHATVSAASQPAETSDEPSEAANTAVPMGADILAEFDSLHENDATDPEEAFSYRDDLSSSVTQFEWEHERRYHGFKKGRYVLPNDEDEMEREDMKHHMIVVLLQGRLYLAPIGEDPRKILDVGTGTGIWAVEMADKFPSAEVIGTDFSPIQPEWVPPNCTFEIDDAEAEWVYPQDSFDFIHVRHMFPAIYDWPKLIRQSLKALRPGGYAEFCEIHPSAKSYDGTLPENSQLVEMGRIFQEACTQRGLQFDAGLRLKGYLQDAGFFNVEEQVFDLPVGRWPKDKRLKEVGAFNHAQFRGGLGAIALAMWTRTLGWTRTEVEVFLAGVRNEIDNRKIHACWKVYVVYGMKPMSTTSPVAH